MNFFHRACSRAMRIFRTLNVHFVVFCVAHYEVNSTYRTFQQSSNSDALVTTTGNLGNFPCICWLYLSLRIHQAASSRPTNSIGGRPALASHVQNLWAGTASLAAASRSDYVGLGIVLQVVAGDSAGGRRQKRNSPTLTSLDRLGAYVLGSSCNWSPALLGRGELWLFVGHNCVATDRLGE